MADTGTGVWFSAQRMCTKVMEPTETVRSVWTVNNFPALQTHIGERIKSDPIHSEKFEWSMSFFPNGSKQKHKDYISIRLGLETFPPGSRPVKIEFSIHLLGQNNQSVLSKSKEDSFNYASVCGHGWGNFCLRSDILDQSKGYLTNGNLKIGIELKIIKDVETLSLGLKQHYKIPANHMPDYLSSLNDETFTDFDIENADGETVKVHKVILAKFSPVFARMFSSDSLEGVLVKSVEIKNFSAGNLREFINFIYSGKMDQNQMENVELIKELCRAAAVYEVVPLKELCENLLFVNLTKTWENTLSILETAHIYGNADLKEAAIRSILMNKEKILNAPKWEEFLNQNPDLAQETICKLANVTPKKADN